MNVKASVNDLELKRLVDLVAEGKSDNTKYAYGRALARFAAWMSKQKPKYTLKGLSGPMVEEYVRYLQRAELSPATINQNLSAIRALAGKLMLESQDRQALDEILRIPNLIDETPIAPGRALSVLEVRRLLSVPDTSTLRGKRDKAILALLLGAGLRREEAAELEVGQITCAPTPGLRSEVCTLSDDGRSIPVPDWAMLTVTDWQDAAGISNGKLLRAIAGADAEQPVTDSLSPLSVHNIVKQLGSRVPGLKTVTPDDLRRTWARRAYEQGITLNQISTMLGHASLVTTAGYLGLDKENLDRLLAVTY